MTAVTFWRSLRPTTSVAWSQLVAVGLLCCLVTPAMGEEDFSTPPGTLQTKRDECTKRNRCGCKAISLSLFNMSRDEVVKYFKREHEMSEKQLVIVEQSSNRPPNKVVWTSPRLEPNTLLCPGSKVWIGISIPKPVEDMCDTPNYVEQELIRVPLAGSARTPRAKVIKVASPENDSFTGTFWVREQWPKPAEQPKVPCKSELTLVVQAKVPMDQLIKRPVGQNEAFITDKNGGGLWSLCDGTLSTDRLRCAPPPAGQIIMSQWPGPGEWAERPGEIVVYTRDAKRDSSLEKAVTTASVLGGIGYVFWRRLRGRSSAPPPGTTSMTDPRIEKIAVRGHIDRP